MTSKSFGFYYKAKRPLQSAKGALLVVLLAVGYLSRMGKTRGLGPQFWRRFVFAFALLRFLIIHIRLRRAGGVRALTL